MEMKRKKERKKRDQRKKDQRLVTIRVMEEPRKNNVKENYSRSEGREQPLLVCDLRLVQGWTSRDQEPEAEPGDRSHVADLAAPSGENTNHGNTVHKQDQKRIFSQGGEESLGKKKKETKNIFKDKDIKSLVTFERKF